MFGRRTAIGVGCCVLVLGCGGTVTHGADDGDAGSSAAGGRGGRPSDGGGAPGRAGTAGVGGSAGSGSGGLAEPPPIDAGCPTEALPPPDITCDPFALDACGPGFGCHPYVDHPAGSGCDAQVYGTQCVPAGSGVQGSLCGDAAGNSCAAGFVCVVGQRAGKRCAALCKLGEPNQCSGGLLCSDLDVSGFGVCG
jgi:hypothetical protein